MECSVTASAAKRPSIGLLIFAAGSAICAVADNIYVLLAGRFLQGAGAIGSVVTAMIADHVREDQRAHAMAVMGMTIAMSFAAAMIIGPIVGGFGQRAVLAHGHSRARGTGDPLHRRA